MADYLTQTRLENALGASTVIRLTDDAGTGSVNTSVLAQVIADAESDLNSRLYKGYQGPVTVVDHGQRAFDIVVSLAVRIARFHLFLRRPQTVTDAIQQDYDAALKATLAMAKGAQALAGDPPVPRTSSESPSASHRLLANRTTKPANRSWSRDDTGNM